MFPIFLSNVQNKNLRPYLWVKVRLHGRQRSPVLPVTISILAVRNCSTLTKKKGKTNITLQYDLHSIQNSLLCQILVVITSKLKTH